MHVLQAMEIQKDEGLGRSKGGFTTKIHAKVDALGNPLKFIITAGQVADVTQAKSFLAKLRNLMFWEIRDMILMNFETK